jgi:putative FmdB family regulatory protein
MPTYQYACTDAICGNRFELVQAFTDPSATECPVCGRPVRKVYGSVGIVFKGSGFYRTDSRAEKKTANGKKTGDRAGSSADTGRSESTPKSGSAAATDSAGSANGKTDSSHASDSGAPRSAGSGRAAKTAAST